MQNSSYSVAPEYMGNPHGMMVQNQPSIVGLLFGVPTMMRFIGGVIVVGLLLSSCSSSNESAAECEETPVESDTGLIYEDVVCGNGTEAVAGTSVTIEYTAELADGGEFASSENQGGEFVFPLGRGQVINGLDEGVRSMKVGGTRRLMIPPELAYGDAGFAPHVGPDENVVYEVTLLDVTED